MNELMKIRDVSLKYNISARTLRYYEDMGLIKSIRNDDYAYRLYDDTALKRLEQIIILRKLNISIKDIQRIFNSSSSDVVLEVLNKKVRDIDEDISLLNELKEIMVGFIELIKQSDFNKDSDLNLLYEKAKEIKTQLMNVNYSDNPSIENRSMEVTEKLDKKIPDIMIIRIQKFRAVTSGLLTFEELFSGDFESWQEAHNHLFKPVIFDCPDFLCEKDGKSNGFGQSKMRCQKQILIHIKLLIILEDYMQLLLV